MQLGIACLTINMCASNRKHRYNCFFDRRGGAVERGVPEGGDNDDDSDDSETSGHDEDDPEKSKK